MTLLVAQQVLLFGGYWSGALTPPWDFYGSYTAEAFAWWADGSFFDPPAWMPYQWGGYAAAASVQNSAWYLPVGATVVVGGPTVRVAAVLSALHVAGGALGAYVLVRRWVGPGAPAVFALVAYGFATPFFANASHVDIGRAAAWLPWVALIASPRWPWHRRWSVQVAALLLWQFAVSSYPGVVVMAGYALLVAVIGWQASTRPRTGAFLVPLAVAGLAAVGLSLVKYLPTALVRGLEGAPAASVPTFDKAILATVFLPHDVDFLPMDVTMRSFFVVAPVLVLVAFAPVRWAATRAALALVVVPVVLGIPRWPWWDQVAALPGLGISRFRMMDARTVLVLGLVVLAAAGLAAVLRRTSDAAARLPADAAGHPADAARSPIDTASIPADAARLRVDAAGHPTDAARSLGDAAVRPSADAAPVPADAAAPPPRVRPVRARSVTVRLADRARALWLVLVPIGALVLAGVTPYVWSQWIVPWTVLAASAVAVATAWREASEPIVATKPPPGTAVPAGTARPGTAAPVETVPLAPPVETVPLTPWVATDAPPADPIALTPPAASDPVPAAVDASVPVEVRPPTASAPPSSPVPARSRAWAAVALVALAVVSGTHWAVEGSRTWRVDRVRVETGLWGATSDQLAAERPRAVTGQRPARLGLPEGATDAVAWSHSWNAAYFSGDATLTGSLNLKGTDSFDTLRATLTRPETFTELQAFWAAPGAVVPDGLDAEKVARCAATGDCGALTVTPAGYEPGHLSYQVVAVGDVPVAFNEAYYDGWELTACAPTGECRDLAVAPADGAVAATVPAGAWDLELVYRTPGQGAGWVAFAGGLLLAAGWPVLGRRPGRRGSP